jgi:anti-sigma B factor antagonist
VSAPGGTEGSAILRLSGDVDALTQEEYRRMANEMLADSTPQRLVVDMAEVATIDSSGLGLLVHLQSMTRENDVAMVLAHVPPRADALLKRTGLDRVFQIDNR